MHISEGWGLWGSGITMGLLSGAGSGLLVLLGKASPLKTRKAAPTVAPTPNSGSRPGGGFCQFWESLDSRLQQRELLWSPLG